MVGVDALTRAIHPDPANRTGSATAGRRPRSDPVGGSRSWPTIPRVAIIGAGIVGCSLADELVMRGWTDVTVIDQGPLFAAGGSTSHAPGLVFQTNGSKTMAEFARYTVEKSCDPGARRAVVLQPGRQPRARPDRRSGCASCTGGRASPRRGASRAGSSTPTRPPGCGRCVDRDAILGAYHVPTDGLAKAVRVSEAQARRATEGGARFLGEHTVTAIRTDDGRVRAVVTDQGEIEADIVVCAAGIWGPRIGAMVGMTVPLQPLAHQYTRTDAAARGRRLRHPARSRERPPDRPRPGPRPVLPRARRPAGGGCATATRRCRSMPADLRHPSEAPVMPSVLDVHARHLRASRGRWAQGIVPALRAPGVEHRRAASTGSSRSRTDGMPLMGESPRRRRASGWPRRCGSPIGCGVGRAMAEWLVDGGSPTDLHECDVNRFEAAPAGAVVHPRPGHPELRRGLRHHPSAPADGGAAAAADLAVLRARAGARGVLPRGQRLGAAALVRRQRGAAGPLRRSRAANAWAARYWHPIAGAEALRDARHGRPVRHDLAQAARGRPGRARSPSSTGSTTNRLDRPVGTVVVHAACSTSAAGSAAT